MNARKVLNDLLSYAEREVCPHDSTHRGGAIWEICDDCGAKWADDRGGKPKFEWPKAIVQAREYLEFLDPEPLERRPEENWRGPSREVGGFMVKLSEDAKQQQAEAWQTVTRALDEYVPDWLESEETAEMCAVYAIERLSFREESPSPSSQNMNHEHQDHKEGEGVEWPQPSTDPNWDKPEWSPAEGTPPAGVECILESLGFSIRNEKVLITYVGDGVGCYKVINSGMEYSFSVADAKFKPLKSHRDKVIEAAMGCSPKDASAREKDMLYKFSECLFICEMLKLPEVE